MRQLTIIGGCDKSGLPEPIREVTVKTGQVYSIVGFTGSGKSQLIQDIEQMAQRDTVTGRCILIDGQSPAADWRQITERKLVAHLSQNMNFVMDMRVDEFLRLHADCRGLKHAGEIVDEVISSANTLAGEAIKADDLLICLSGGQSRALMIADVAIISDSPIILIDEIENAGINRRVALQILSERGKIVLIVTHDPLLALMGEQRIVMKKGAMQKIVMLSNEEREVRKLLEISSDTMFLIQNELRRGENLRNKDLIGKTTLTNS